MATCSGTNRQGNPCSLNAIPGGVVCWRHGGKAPQVKAKAAVRVELLSWGVDQDAVDPGETLLKLVTQSWYRATDLKNEMNRVIGEADNLRDALIGDAWVGTEDGGAVQSGDYLRGLTILEAQERERCARWSTQAIAAGLAERTVRLAERQGALIAELLRAVMNDPQLGLTEDQRRALPDVAERHLELVC